MMIFEDNQDFIRGRDYEHDDDFDYHGAEWHDITRIGSRYLVQIDILSPTFQRRHREIGKLGPWVSGDPDK